MTVVINYVKMSANLDNVEIVTISVTCYVLQLVLCVTCYVTYQNYLHLMFDGIGGRIMID